ncbi:MAG: GntR family transcriptional regulator [Asticcacaulis sp.]|uniref:GntR family transcriptional regulator n=1 Tax=Asticcacaulis sp. TaxID=1872648 RepID=UPI003F7CB384
MKGSVNERVYRAIKTDILAGTYAPGARVEAATLADRHRVSVTPVRIALYRLVGEELLDNEAHEGFHLPRVTESAIRDLLDWNCHLLVSAAKSRNLPIHLLPDMAPLRADLEPDLVRSAERLFLTIASLSGNTHHVAAVARNNDRLRAIRLVMGNLLDKRRDDLVMLIDHLDNRDFGGLGRSLVTYHRRRRALVSDLVRMLHQAPLAGPTAPPPQIIS